MKSFEQAYTSEEQKQSADIALAALPLPTAALVIDVRNNHQDELSLLDFLIADVEDLAMEMRLSQVPRWRFLAECIDFLSLSASDDATSEDATSVDARSNGGPTTSSKWDKSQFVLTTRDGRQIPLRGFENLMKFIGRDYLDSVRNSYIGATRDTTAPFEMFTATRVDPEQSTVRVFFLTDMDDLDSLRWAARYADGLKQWCAESHGQRRFSRADYMQSIVFCWNAHATNYAPILHAELAQAPSSAIDQVLLMHRYSDNEAYIDEQEQIRQIELILSSFLLRWPALFENAREQFPGPLVHAESGAITPAWPIYIVGGATLEYSARRAARWLHYGVTSRLLEMLIDTKKAEQDAPANQLAVQKWLKQWWHDVRQAAPVSLTSTIEELRVFPTMEHALKARSLVHAPPAHTLEQFTRFRQQVGSFYLGDGLTLQHALESRTTILTQVRAIYTQKLSPGDEDPAQNADEPYGQLQHLYELAKHFLSQNAQGAWGALPTAIHQLATLNDYAIQEIDRVARALPDLAARRAQFEQQADLSYSLLQKKVPETWPVPFLGRFPRASVCVFIVIVLLELLCTVLKVLGNYFPSLNRLPYSLIIGVVAVLLPVISSALHYMIKKKQVQHECRQITSQITILAQQHISEVSVVIASYVAEDFLQHADLSGPRGQSPYAQRLRDLSLVLKDAQEQAAERYALADAWLNLTVSGQHRYNRTLSENLHSRKDILPWNRVEEALLLFGNDFTDQTTPTAHLAELLVRRFSAETVAELLADVLSKLEHAPQHDEHMRLQVISSLLVVCILIPEMAVTEVPAVLSLLKEYTALKDYSQQEFSVISSDIRAVQNIIKYTLVERTQTSTDHFSRLQHLSPASLFAIWVGDQLSTIPELADIFSSNSVLERLERSEISPTRILDSLRLRCTLAGRPDEISGDDYYYLFIAPGIACDTFLDSLGKQQAASIQLVPFPDRETLAYFHIHRVRQISSPSFLES